MIKETTIQQVRMAADITDIVSEYVPNLKRAGKDFKGLCPFHTEKTPSFMVSPGKGIFHCFGCGKGGDAIRFVMEIEGISYPEAIENLAEKYNIPVEKTEAQQNNSQLEKLKRLLGLLERAKDYYHKLFFESAAGQPAQEYIFSRRGMQTEIVREFGLGWADTSGTDLCRMAQKAGYAPEELLAAGVAMTPQSSHSLKDWMRGRIVFPIYDLKGHVVAFGGRVLDEQQQPKYLNTPETQLFHKSRNLYGFFQGAREIRTSRSILLCEGYMDVLSCHQAGIRTAVAPLGTAFTRDQAFIIKRYADRVTVLFDSDNAGTQAALRASEVLLEVGLLPIVAQVVGAKDVDEFLQKEGRGALENLLKNSPNALEFYAGLLLKGQEQDPQKRTEAARQIYPWLMKLEDRVLRQETLDGLVRKFGFPEEAFRSEFGKFAAKDLNRNLRRAEFNQSRVPMEEKQEPRRQFLTLDEELLVFLLEHPAYIERFHQEAWVPYFKEEQAAKIFNVLIQMGGAASGADCWMKPAFAEFSTYLASLFARKIQSEKPLSELFPQLIARQVSIRIRERLEQIKVEIPRMIREGNSHPLWREYQDLLQKIKS